MKQLFCLFLILNCAFLFGQDYSIIHSNSKNYYQFDTIPLSFLPQHDVLTDMIDSNIVIGSDTLLFPVQSISNDPPFSQFPPCKNLYDTSWLGIQVIKKLDSTVFNNEKGESIYLQKPTIVNQDWILFIYNNQDYIKATVISFGTMNLLGQSDSIVTISLQVFDNTNTSISSSLNGKEIIISKSNGMVKGFNWNKFPHQETDKPFLITQHDKLAYRDVYDFEINDEFHYRYAPGTVPPAYKIRTVIAKWFSGTDSVTYVYEDIFETQTVDFTFNPPRQTFSSTTTIDTIGYGNLSKIINDVAPSAPIIESTSSFSDISELYIKNLNFNNRSSEVVKELFGFYDVNNQCFLEKDNYYVNEFIKGCGSTNSYFDFSISNGNMPEELQYFKKGTETWGMPHILTGIPTNDINSTVGLTLYPNPVRHVLNIKQSVNDIFRRLEIIDVQGKLVMEKAYDNRMDVSALHQGIYFLRLIGEDQILTKKFLIE